MESLSRISVDVGRAPKIEGRGQELFSDFLASRHITVRNQGAEISGRWGEGRAGRGSGGGVQGEAERGLRRADDNQNTKLPISSGLERERSLVRGRRRGKRKRGEKKGD